MKQHKWTIRNAWLVFQDPIFYKFTNETDYVKIICGRRYQRARAILTLIMALGAGHAAAAAADLGLPLSPAQLGLAFIAPYGHGDPLLLPANPAALVAISDWALASSRANLYGLRALGLFTMAGGLRLGQWVVGAGASQFGSALYLEQDLFLGFAAPPRGPFTLGAAIRYHRVGVKNYGVHGAMVLGLAWDYRITRRTGVYGSIINLSRAGLGAASGRLPQMLTAGLRLQDRSLMLLAEFAKEVAFEPEFRLAVALAVLPALTLRLGMTHRPARFGAGFRLRFALLAVEYGFNHHNSLGYTHMVGAVISR